MCRTAQLARRAGCTKRQSGIIGTAMAGVLLCAASDAGSAGAVASSRTAAAAPTPPATPTTEASGASIAVPGSDAGASSTGGTDVTLDVDRLVEAPSPEAGPSPEADPAPAHCIDEQLTLAYQARPQDSGAGSFFGDLVFTNTSASDCSFRGWPGLIAQSADGVQLGATARASGTASSPVVLHANGGAAISQLQGGNPGAYGCPATTSTTLRAYITSDGAGPGVAVAQSIPVCADRSSTLRVGPLGG